MPYLGEIIDPNTGSRYTFGGIYDWAIERGVNVIAALQGKITPDAYAQVQRQLAIDIDHAGGSAADIASAQRTVDNVVEANGGVGGQGGLGEDILWYVAAGAAVLVGGIILIKVLD